MAAHINGNVGGSFVRINHAWNHRNRSARRPRLRTSVSPRVSRLVATGAVAVVGVITFTSGAIAAPPPPPSNDLIGQAIAITPKDHEKTAPGPVAFFDSTSATLQDQEPQPTGTGCGAVSHTAWYTVTVANATLLHLTASANGNLITPEIAIYTGTLPTTQVACNINGNPVSEETFASIDLSAASGTKYWIQVGTTTADSGPIYLRAYYDTTPTNDTIATSQTLTAPQLVSGSVLDADSAGYGDRVRGDATLATIEQNEPQPTKGGCAPFARTRWFSWTATKAGPFDVTPLGGSKIQVAAWAGDTAPITELGCVTADSNNALRFLAASGGHYWVQIGSTVASGWAAASALFFQHDVPANDEVSAAEQVPLAPITNADGVVLEFDNTLATTSATEPQPTKCTSGVGNSTWYTLSPTEDLVLNAGVFLTSTGGARKGNDVIALYTQGSMAQAACNSYDGSGDSPSSLLGFSEVTAGAVIDAPLKAGTTYLLQVAGTKGQAATGDLFLQATHVGPTLSQTSNHGIVTLTLRTSPAFQGNTVYFFRRSGLTGKVVPLGTGVVDSAGVARRTFNAKIGQILALYGKLIGATNIVSSYSNDMSFKVQ